MDGGTRALRTSSAPVGLSTASVYPESTAAAFELAARLGYDGVELMVWTDPVSQDPYAVRRLAEHYGVPVLAVHAPCLLVTQRVWSPDPWTRLRRAQAAAAVLDAPTVVVHPPFRWQREYARRFHQGLVAMTNETAVRFAVENMFPLRLRGRSMSAYEPTWDVAADADPYPNYTLDLSHTATSQTDALAMFEAMGERLAHVHMADGTGVNKDEHLIPGRGDQPCAEVLEHLTAQGFDGTVIVEVNTRRSVDRAERESDLAEALAFCRLHLVAPAPDPLAA